MNELNDFAGASGFVHQVYCSLCARRVATGEIEVYIDKENSDETFGMPICESCLQAAVDTHV